jgi:UDP-3-O-[3-hydroxymyristoyl] glucosamine N-acyltransferase
MAYPIARSIRSSKLSFELGLKQAGTDVEFDKVGSMSDAGASCLVFSRAKVEKLFEGCVYICDRLALETYDGKASVLLSDNPRLDFMRALKWLKDVGLLQAKLSPPQIHPSAHLGHNVFIENNCTIGEGVIIEPNVVILQGTKIGKNSRIRANSTVGSDGFGFERMVDGDVLRFIHLGGVRIGVEVEIGANCCIARGALDDTVIEDHVKIDNLVHVGHNALISRGAILTAGAEISGGCIVGANSWIGPNSSLIEKVSIGEGALVGIGSTVIRSVPSGEVYVGNPAKFLRKTK